MDLITTTRSPRSTRARTALALATTMAFAITAHAAGKPAGSDAGAAAATLYSAPMYPGTDNLLECAVTNVSATPQDVTVDVIGYAGYPIHKYGQLLDTQVYTLQPLETQRLDVSNDSSFLPMTCRFVVPGGAAAVRASACSRGLSSLHACTDVD